MTEGNPVGVLINGKLAVIFLNILSRISMTSMRQLRSFIHDRPFFNSARKDGRFKPNAQCKRKWYRFPFSPRFSCLRWLPTILTVSTPEEGWRTKNELFDSILGLSSWHSQWRLVTHLRLLFRSYAYIADCYHGNNNRNDNHFCYFPFICFLF